MRRPWQIISGFVLAASVLFGASPAAAATSLGVQDFSFVSYDADYFLARDASGHSTLRTVETFVAAFPSFDQNRGIIRAIPNDYDGVPLHTTVQSVTDANGAAVHFDITDSGRFTELALGTDVYVHGRQSYVITYTQQNVVRAFADTGDDELYWDTNGTGFAQPFGSVTARVHVDPEIVAFLTGNNACYRGAEGSTDTCRIVPDATGRVFGAGTTNLGPGENLSVAIGFEPGTFVQVPAEAGVGGSSSGPSVPWASESMSPWSNVVPGVLLVLSVLGAVLAFVRRLFGPRDAKGRGIIIPQYSVPKGLNLMEASDLVGRGSSALSAQLVSFAVRGNLRILDYPVTGGGAKYTLQLLNRDGVDAQERQLLDALFTSPAVPDSTVISSTVAGAIREIGVTDDALARRLSAVQSRTRAGVITRGLRAKASSRGGILIVGALVVVFVVAIGFFVISAVIAGMTRGGVVAFSPGWLFPVGFVGIVSIIAAGAAAVRPAVLTDSGAEWRDYLRGMREYLQLAEADRFRMLQSPEGAERVDVRDPLGAGVTDDGRGRARLVRLYERLLPFAVLWGVEREWAKELAVYYDQGVASPEWFVTSSVFNSVVFANALNGLSSSVAMSATPAAATSSWSGSGGGSFSGGSFGGGFSGGGGGGGGGGGR